MNVFINKNRVNEIMALAKEIGKIKNNRIDGYYMSALYLLMIPMLKAKSRRYISSEGINFEEMMKKEVFSAGEAEIVSLAANLFNGLAPADPGALAEYLDEDNFMTAIIAIMFRKYGYNLNTENTEEN